ncbi:MAG TPA: hypothetical protein VFA26_01550 [Gemmataceae bacterium]|nr:hypothetical protein [Gemmataceae bacterium]
MPVFACPSCGRLLHRPEEMLGRAWQCFTCGPIQVAEQPAAVSEELARLLEQEYQLYHYGGLQFPNAQTAMPVPLVPPDGRLDGQVPKAIVTDMFRAEPRPEWRPALKITVIALGVGILLLGIAILSPSAESHRALNLGIVVLLTIGLIAGAVLTRSVVFSAFRRRRMLKALQEHGDSVRPGSQSLPAGTTRDAIQHPDHARLTGTQADDRTQEEGVRR